MRSGATPAHVGPTASAGLAQVTGHSGPGGPAISCYSGASIAFPAGIDFVLDRSCCVVAAAKGGVAPRPCARGESGAARREWFARGSRAITSVAYHFTITHHSVGAISMRGLVSMRSSTHRGEPREELETCALQ